MKKVNILDPRVAGYVGIVGALVVVGFLFIRRPPEIRKEMWTKVNFYKHKYNTYQESFSDFHLKDYSHMKDIFLYPSSPHRETNNKEVFTNPLEEVNFNGIIIVDKKYLAIYDKKVNSQQLVAEGEEYKGIKVLSIKENSAIIQVNGEKKEIKF